LFANCAGIFTTLYHIGGGGGGGTTSTKKIWTSICRYKLRQQVDGGDWGRGLFLEGGLKHTQIKAELA